MRAHLVQLDIAWEDRDANFERVRRLLEPVGVEPGDLVALPEMFDSGFSLNTNATADADGRTAAFLAALAADYRCTVQGGRTVRSPNDDLATNQMTCYAPPHTGDGPPTLLADYAKIHPFSFGREPEKFRGGTQVVTYPWSAEDTTLTICPAVCYDLRFPELFRLGLAAGAEVFAIGANWPRPRHAHWRALAIARAIENQGYVLAVNRAGDDPHLSYAGGTIAVDPQGRVIGELGEEEDVLSTPVSPTEIHSWRQAFGAWRDSRLMDGARSGLSDPRA
ncbi:MAG: hydrolase [Phycisphaeraceae bacterium]|nr:MAG: hydrolase [Phycisphaeraceae bacterium]